MRRVVFKSKASEQYAQWLLDNKKVFDRITKLIDDTAHNPFEGIGKPEPLKHELAGCWSRRITKADRLVYQVSDNAIIVISCRYHY